MSKYLLIFKPSLDRTMPIITGNYTNPTMTEEFDSLDELKKFIEKGFASSTYLSEPKIVPVNPIKIYEIAKELKLETKYKIKKEVIEYETSEPIYEIIE